VCACKKQRDGIFNEVFQGRQPRQGVEVFRRFGDQKLQTSSWHGSSGIEKHTLKMEKELAPKRRNLSTLCRCCLSGKTSLNFVAAKASRYTELNIAVFFSVIFLS
jgi:hypothetical protein